MSDISTSSHAGTVTAHDGTIPLQHVDNLVTHVQANIGDARVSAVAQQLLDYDPEAMVWQDSPTLVLILSSVIKWVFLMFIWLGALSYLAPPAPSVQEGVIAETPVEAKKGAKKPANGASKSSAPSHAKRAGASASEKKAGDTVWYDALKWGGALVFLFQLYSHLVWALRLKCVKYKMSSQRLIIESGIFSRTSNTYELHTLDAGHIQTPFLLRLFGRSNLHAGVWLNGIRNAEAVRDLIRNAGQIEAGRFDKARWR